MKILMDDGSQIQLGTGIGKMSEYLFRAMQDNGVDISLVEEKPVDKAKRKKERLEYIAATNSRKYMKSLLPYDYVLYTNYAIPFRNNGKTKYAVVIHDMVSFLYPKTLPVFYRVYNKLMIMNSVKKADIIFTPSEAVKKEILSLFPKCKERIHVTWWGVCDGIAPLDEYLPYENRKLQGIDDSPYFLFVSTVEKRKNVGMVLEAFIKLKRQVAGASNYKLVIAGRPGYGYEEFVQLASESGYSDDIIFTGYTSDADCNRLYNHARAFVFPTVYEGFGFAQIECMKCHLPIILSDIPTNREISREYGEFFDLNDTDSLVKKMQLITENKYDYQRKNALADQYLKDFDWNIIAKQYAGYLEDVLSNEGK